MSNTDFNTRNKNSSQSQNTGSSQNLKDKVADAGAEIKQRAGGALKASTDTARDKFKEAADAAREAGAGAADSFQDQAREQQRSGADFVGRLAGNIRDAARAFEQDVPFAARGINTAAEILADALINDPLRRATDKLFGLNRFEIDPIISGQRLNPTARLTVGRQINRNLLITYSTNLSEDQQQVLALEYRVSNRLSFVAQYAQRSLRNVTRKQDSGETVVNVKPAYVFDISQTAPIAPRAGKEDAPRSYAVAD